ncbi:MAG: hypothetical protein CVV59_00215 [Tenericutes bacterium HGW-Tenericutes-4]|nr:MAG: hypothetical protein CVV59_00215 [Tenericutes bacterium HGW-Tenericutes-4]
MKMRQSKHFIKAIEVEGYVLPQEWEQIDAFLNSKKFKFSTLDLSRVTNVNIPKEAFINSANLQEVVLPENLVTIEKSAFENCISLKRVYFSKTLKKIEENAFKNCSLEHFIAPKTLEFLGNKAFLNNRFLSNIKLNENLEFLGEDVFLCENDFVKTAPIKTVKEFAFDENEF